MSVVPPSLAGLVQLLVPRSGGNTSGSGAGFGAGSSGGVGAGAGAGAGGPLAQPSGTPVLVKQLGPTALLVVVKAAPEATALFDDILLWFSKCGEIERSSAPSRLQAVPEAPLHAFSSVVVTFGVEGAVEAALSMRSKRLNPSLFVTQACMDAYRSARPEPAALQQEVDKRMAAFEAREAAAAAAKEAADGKEDDDGFILVTKKAKDKPFESDNRKLKRKKQEQEQGGAGMQLAPFYRFQLRESKRNRECWCPAA